MKAVTIDQFGGVEEMHWSDLPTPEPQDNEVQIAIKCTSVNPVDWKIREGSLKNIFKYAFPMILGWDAAGTISAVGKNVKSFKAGDEVFTYCRKPTVQWGTYAEYVCFDAAHVAKKPANISFAQAAAMPLVSLTAWQALFEIANLQEGETVLIHAGAGGVGSVAIELARTAGATIYTTASSSNHDYVKSLGAHVAIDYHQENFVKRIHELEPQGVDVVLDCAGGDTLLHSYEVVKPGGCLVSIVSKPNETKAKEKEIHSAFMIVSPNGEQLSKVAQLLSEEKIKPPHITEMPLTDFAKAIEMNRKGHTKGKIVLRVSDRAPS